MYAGGGDGGAAAEAGGAGGPDGAGGAGGAAAVYIIHGADVRKDCNEVYLEHYPLDHQIHRVLEQLDLQH